MATHGLTIAFQKIIPDGWDFMLLILTIYYNPWLFMVWTPTSDLCTPKDNSSQVGFHTFNFNHGLKPMATQKITGNPGSSLPHLTLNSKKFRGGRESLFTILTMGWNLWLRKRQRVILVSASRIWLWIQKKFRGGKKLLFNILTIGWNPWLPKRQRVILIPSSRMWL